MELINPNISQRIFTEKWLSPRSKRYALNLKSLCSYTRDIKDFPKKVPNGHWDSVSNQRLFMDALAKKLNITDMEGWYKATITRMRENGGGSLLSRNYKGSRFKLLSTVYPEYLRNDIVFSHLDYLGKEVNFNCMFLLDTGMTFLVSDHL